MMKTPEATDYYEAHANEFYSLVIRKYYDELTVEELELVYRQLQSHADEWAGHVRRRKYPPSQGRLHP